jgi:hypothetical protein
MWRAAEDGVMPIQRGGPQRHIRGAARVHLVGRDDLLLRFLEGDEIPNSFGLEILPFRMVAVCGSKRLRTLSRTWVSPPSNRARVWWTTRSTSGRIRCKWARAWSRIGAAPAAAVRRRCAIRRTIVSASRRTARVVAVSFR